MCCIFFISFHFPLHLLYFRSNWTWMVTNKQSQSFLVNLRLFVTMVCKSCISKGTKVMSTVSMLFKKIWWFLLMVNTPKSLVLLCWEADHVASVEILMLRLLLTSKLLRGNYLMSFNILPHFWYLIQPCPIKMTPLVNKHYWMRVIWVGIKYLDNAVTIFF